MDNHLDATKPLNKTNRRNGKMPKEVQTEYGAVNIDTPRDREGIFLSRDSKEASDHPGRGTLR
jgi:transposase-like protein